MLKVEVSKVVSGEIVFSTSTHSLFRCGISNYNINNQKKLISNCRMNYWTFHLSSGLQNACSKINVIEHYVPPKRYFCHCLCLLGKTWLLLYIIDLFNQLQPVSWWIILNSSELNAQVGYTDRLSPVCLYVCKHFPIFFSRTTGANFNQTWQKSFLGDKDKGLKEGHAPFQEGSMRNSENTSTIILFLNHGAIATKLDTNHFGI